MTYEEGRDVAPIADPKMGRVPWPGAYDLWHEPPEVRLPPGSRIADGDVVRADYYHMATIYGFQVTASLTEPAVFDIVHGQLASLRRECRRPTRSAAGCWATTRSASTAGTRHRGRAAARPARPWPTTSAAVHDDALAIDPDAALYTWSDMFDPHHNAAERTDPYYLVNGDWSGSWEGLPPAVTILNWNHQAGKRRALGRVLRRPRPPPDPGRLLRRPPAQFGDRAWLEDLEGVPGIEGVLYTQWGSGYDKLEAWAEHVWGDAAWATPTPTLPSPTAHLPSGTTPATALPTAPPSGTTPPRAPPPPSATVPPLPSPRAYLPWAWR